MSNVIIVGGGAAGMMAAIAAAGKGHAVTLLEQNEKLGKKIYITGKGRCNLTNASDIEDVFANIISNPKFLYSAIYGFDNTACMDFFTANGLKIKTERGNRVFPVSDHASDVIKTLEKSMKDLGVKIHLNTRVKELLTEPIEGDNANADLNDNCSNNGNVLAGEQSKYDKKSNKKNKCTARICGVKDQHGKSYKADAVIMATGGVSYATTGATGEGLRLSEKCGHKVTDLYPALVPLEAKEGWCKEVMGLALKNVNVTIKNGKKVLYNEFGEMLFTHFGVSGPLILSASSKINQVLAKQNLLMFIDLKPALSEEQLQKRLLRDFEDNHQKQLKNVMGGLLPAGLVPIVIRLSEVDPDKKVCDISKVERTAIVNCLKALPLTIVGTREFNEAIITKGGVSVKDINPSTMESKVVKGLYFAGEMIDVDALTGGYNLQIAWSTGHLAGEAVE